MPLYNIVHYLYDIETPNVPLNVLVSGVQLSAPCRLSVSWDPPNNSKKFDLDHFKVHILLPEPENYIANGTSMEPVYHFHLDSVMVPPQSSIHVAVTAVSKCSQHRLSGPFAIEPIPEINDKVVSKTEGGPRPEEYRHNLNTMNGNKTTK